MGLNKAVEEFIERTRPQRVYAFLAAKSPYAKIIEKVNWAYLRATSGVRDGTIITVDSPGMDGAQQVVPRLLGRAIVEFLDGNQPTSANKLLASRSL